VCDLHLQIGQTCFAIFLKFGLSLFSVTLCVIAVAFLGNVVLVRTLFSVVVLFGVCSFSCDGCLSCL